MEILGKNISRQSIDMTDVKHYTYRISLQYIVVIVFEIQDYV